MPAGTGTETETVSALQDRWELATAVSSALHPKRCVLPIE
jgi:hypothetical protein